MSIQNINVPNGISVIQVNTLSATQKVLLLPTCSTNQGRYFLVKDAFGNAANNNIQISTTGLDLIDGVRNRYPFSTSWGTLSLLADGNLAWRVSGMYLGQLTPPAPSGGGLYTFTTITFTNAGATGRTGPTLLQCTTAYSATNPWVTDTAFFNMVSQGIQLWTVPASGSYSFTVAGSRGGNAGGRFGLGAVVSLTLSLTQGDILQIACGQPGGDNAGGCTSDVGGGGGGTFVRNSNTATWLVVAGGGGGGGGSTQPIVSANNGQLTTNGGTPPGLNAGAGGTGGSGGTVSFTGCAQPAAAGAGITGNGQDATVAGSGGSNFANGLLGGLGNGGFAVGGFGGGGGVGGQYGGGGAGGYSGGGGGGLNTCACSDYSGGGGGGSFGIVAFTTSSSTNTSNGYCTVTRL